MTCDGDVVSSLNRISKESMENSGPQENDASGMASKFDKRGCLAVALPGGYEPGGSVRVPSQYENDDMAGYMGAVVEDVWIEGDQRTDTEELRERTKPERAVTFGCMVLNSTLIWKRTMNHEIPIQSIISLNLL